MYQYESERTYLKVSVHKVPLYVQPGAHVTARDNILRLHTALTKGYSASDGS